MGPPLGVKVVVDKSRVVVMGYGKSVRNAITKLEDYTDKIAKELREGNTASSGLFQLHFLAYLSTKWCQVIRVDVCLSVECSLSLKMLLTLRGHCFNGFALNFVRMIMLTKKKKTSIYNDKIVVLIWCKGHDNRLFIENYFVL